MSIMLKGFLLNSLIAAIAALLLRVTITAGTSYGARLKIVATAGLAAIVLIHLGDVVWWLAAGGWELARAFYNLTAWMLGSAIVARFIVAPEERTG